VSLLEAGLKFLDSLSVKSTAGAPARPVRTSLQQTLNSCVHVDPKTHRPSLTIPLPQGFTAERMANSIGSLLSRLSASLSNRAGT
jgi:hypothetical protein